MCNSNKEMNKMNLCDHIYATQNVKKKKNVFALFFLKNSRQLNSKCLSKQVTGSIS